MHTIQTNLHTILAENELLSAQQKLTNLIVIHMKC